VTSPSGSWNQNQNRIRRPEKPKRYPFFRVHRVPATLTEISDHDTYKGSYQLIWKFREPAGPFMQIAVPTHKTVSPAGKLYKMSTFILGIAPDDVIKASGIDGLVKQLIGRQNVLSISVVEHSPGKFGSPYLKKIHLPPVAVAAPAFAGVLAAQAS